MIQTSFIVYTQSGQKCPYCEKAIDLLDQAGLAYMLRPQTGKVLRNTAERANMTTVPIIYHGVKLIGGYNELKTYLETLVPRQRL